MFSRAFTQIILFVVSLLLHGMAVGSCCIDCWCSDDGGVVKDVEVAAGAVVGLPNIMGQEVTYTVEEELL